MRVGESQVGPSVPWFESLYKDTYVRSSGGLNWAWAVSDVRGWSLKQQEGIVGLDV